MNLRSTCLGLALAGALWGQTTFIQMTDPQFGFFTNNKSFDHETANFEFAVAAANRSKPAFVVMTGDLVNKAGDPAQTAEYKRIAAKLDPGIKLYNVPGNHDYSDPLTQESLAQYRALFGTDYYVFRESDIAGIVVNSSLMKNADKFPDEAAKMESWLRVELEKARQAGAKHILVFQHYPLFLKSAGEPDQYFNIPLEVRKRYLALFHEYGVKQVFAGHTHVNQDVRDGDLEMIVTGPVGKPLGGKSGFAIVKVSDEGVTHKFYDFGDLP